MRVPGNYRPGRYTVSFSAKSGDGGVVLFDAAAAADVSGEIRPLSDGSICIQKLSSEAEAVSWKTAAYTNGYTHLSLCFGLGALPKNASIQIKDIKIEYDEAYGSPAADGAIGVGVWSAAEPSEKMTGTLDSDGTAKFTFPAAADSDWGSTGKITLPAARPGKIYKVTASVASDKPDIKIGANFRANVTGYIKPGTAWTWMNPSALGDGRIELYTASVFDSGVDVMYPTLEIATGSACTLTVKDVRMTEASPADVDFYIYGEVAGWDFEKFDYAKGTAVLIGKKSQQMQILMLKKGVKPSWELSGEGMCKLANFSVGAGITMAEEDEDDPGTLSFTSDETTFAAVKLNGVTPEVSKVPVDEAAAMYGIERVESADGKTVELDLSARTGNRYVPAVTFKTEPGVTYKFSCDIAASGGISLSGYDYTEDNFEMIPIFSGWGADGLSYETYFSTESKDVFVYVFAGESGRITVSNILLEKQETPLYEVTENADGSYIVAFNYDEWAEAPLGEISTTPGMFYEFLWNVDLADGEELFCKVVDKGGYCYNSAGVFSGNETPSFYFRAKSDVARVWCASTAKCVATVAYAVREVKKEDAFPDAYETYNFTGSPVGWASSRSEGAVPLVKKSPYVYEASFIADDSEVWFCITQDGWENQMGGTVFEAESMSDGAGYRAVDNGVGGYNGCFFGLEKNAVYTMTIDFTEFDGAGGVMISLEKVSE